MIESMSNSGAMWGAGTGIGVLALYKLGDKLLDILKAKFSKNGNGKTAIDLIQNSEISKKVDETKVKLLMATQKELCMDRVETKIDKLRDVIVEGQKGIHNRLDALNNGGPRYGSD